jgi:hypothetical protein
MKNIRLCDVEAPYFVSIRLTDGSEVFSLYALSTFHFPGRFQLLMFISGTVHTRAVILLEGLGQFKIQWLRRTHHLNNASKYPIIFLLLSEN